jgi:hypothetical protein
MICQEKITGIFSLIPHARQVLFGAPPFCVEIKRRTATSRRELLPLKLKKGEGENYRVSENLIKVLINREAFTTVSHHA